MNIVLTPFLASNQDESYLYRIECCACVDDLLCMKYVLSPLPKFSGFKDLSGVSVFHVEFVNHLLKGDGWQN